MSQNTIRRRGRVSYCVCFLYLLWVWLSVQSIISGIPCSVGHSLHSLTSHDYVLLVPLFDKRDNVVNIQETQ